MRIKNILAMTILASCGLMMEHALPMQQDEQFRDENSRIIQTFIIKSILPPDYNNETETVKLPDTLVSLINHIEEAFCQRAIPHMRNRKLGTITLQDLNYQSISYQNIGYTNDHNILLNSPVYGLLHALYRHDPNISQFIVPIINGKQPQQNNRIDFAKYCPIDVSRIINHCVKKLTNHDRADQYSQYDKIIVYNAIILRSILGAYSLSQKGDFINTTPTQDKDDDRYLFDELNGGFRFAFTTSYNQYISLGSIFRSNNRNDPITTITNPFNINDLTTEAYNHYKLPQLINIKLIQHMLKLNFTEQFTEGLYCELLKKFIRSKYKVKIPLISTDYNPFIVQLKYGKENISHYYKLTNQSVQKIDERDIPLGAPHTHETFTETRRNFTMTYLAAMYEVPASAFIYTLYSDIGKWHTTVQQKNKPQFNVSDDVFNYILTIINNGFKNKINELSHISRIDMSVYKIYDIPLKCIINRGQSIKPNSEILLNGLSEDALCEIQLPENVIPINDTAFQNQNTEPQSEGENGWQEVGQKKKSTGGKKKSKK